MAEYRVYEIGDDDHIVKSTPLVCKDDHEAIARAGEFTRGHVIEIWSRERFVARLDPEVY
jgi:hypothetical protein